jgi:hypothetical protein
MPKVGSLLRGIKSEPGFKRCKLLSLFALSRTQLGCNC